MNKTAFLFSGQGSQYAGMGRELCDNFPQAKAVYDAASEKFGYDVLALSLNGSEEELSKTAVSQPLIFTLSMAAYRVLEANGLKPDAVAGFSLGEVSALTAAGAMSLETGFDVIARRAAAMQTAAESVPGAMFAVLGADAETVEAACAAVSGNAGAYAVPVNYNCPGQIVIAGTEDTVKAAAKALSDAGHRVVRLSVNAAFHSKLMEPASEKFFAGVSGVSYGAAGVDFYSNVTGDRAEVDDIASYLKKQMTSPVRFSTEMESMRRDGIDTFVELGPGKTLCGFIRRGLRGSSFYNVEDLASAEKCISALGTR